MKLQVIWILLGAGGHIWIGGYKGFVVLLIGAIIFYINSVYVGKREDKLLSIIGGLRCKQ